MNLPNKITVIRIFLIPFIIFFYLADFLGVAGKIVATVLFIVASLTDFLDGYLARKLNMTTTLGVFLDTNADKMLTSVGIMLVAFDHTIPSPYGIIIALIFVCRDIIITALKQLAASNNFIMQADKLGKFKAACQMVAIPFLMVLATLNITSIAASSYAWFAILSYVLIGIATILTIVSMCNYLIKNKKLLKQN